MTLWGFFFLFFLEKMTPYTQVSVLHSSVVAGLVHSSVHSVSVLPRKVHSKGVIILVMPHRLLWSSGVPGAAPGMKAWLWRYPKKIFQLVAPHTYCMGSDPSGYLPHHTFCMVEPVIYFVWGLIGGIQTSPQSNGSEVEFFLAAVHSSTEYNTYKYIGVRRP